MLKLDSVLVYHWQAWKGFLISHLVADYCVVQAKYTDNIKTFEHCLTPNIQAVLMQINLSHSANFPAGRQQLIKTLQARNIPVLNTDIEDISKHNLHYLLKNAGLRSAKADKNGPAHQRLFVKSNLNWGGATEQRLPDTLQHQWLGQKPALIQRWDDYYCVKRSDISPEYWSDDSIVIETYIENPENSFFRVYGLGDSMVIVKAHSDALIKKISGHPNDKNFMLTRQQIFSHTTTLPEDLQKTIRDFIIHYPLMYFCLDIVHDTQQYYIVDLNLTPYAGVQEQTTEAIEFLCQGAHTYLKNRSQQDLIPV